ncbi:hypothetical protein B7463_g8097, partial [Scytalidium lignicola]
MLAKRGKIPSAVKHLRSSVETMASRSVSPGGALLRASRVFSIPTPLPRPISDLSSAGAFVSDTATLPHPIELSIETPQSSLAKGDWGFKRPLPLRSTTNTSTPLIRVKAIDTYEHITEFGSAADHTLSLRKWQEMGVPLSPPVKSRGLGDRFESTFGSGKSVFEDDIDSTVPSTEQNSRREDAGWKFKGPWLSGLSDGNFSEYIQKQVRRRKGEFHKFLRTACAAASTRQAQRAAREQGVEIPPPVEASQVTEEQLREFIKVLRHDRSELYKQIRDFLDLPPSPAPKIDMPGFFNALLSNDQPKSSSSSQGFMQQSDSPYAESGPPKTHPSAGLSYLRTSAYTYNHPIYGPQKTAPPVQARVVMPKGASIGNFAPALGVGGFVAAVPSGSSAFDLRTRKKGRPNRATIPGLFQIELDKAGGSKTYVQPTSASIDPKGRVILNVQPADPEAVSVAEGTVNELPQEYQRPKPEKTIGFAKPPASSDGYGLSGLGGGAKV